jgi:hypothetical protein
MPSLLFRNDRDGTFSEVALVSGCAYNWYARPQAGMGLAVGDYDGDGWLDIFKTHFQNDTPVLFRGHADGVFSDETEPAGLGKLTRHVCWGVDFVDYDNDGWSDLFYVTGHVYQDPEQGDAAAWSSPQVVLRNLGDGTFADVSAELGPGVSEERSSRGSAYGDYDNDGDVDVVVNNVHDAPDLYRLESNNSHHWLLVKLVGTRSNRSAIGARLRCVAAGSVRVEEVRGGGSYISQNDLRVHFGLGDAARVDRLEVRWPSGLEERFPDLAVDLIHTLVEGTGQAAGATR